MIVRISTLFVAVVIGTKLVLFASSNARLVDAAEALSALEEHLTDLIDESLRYREEVRERAEAADREGRALSFAACVRAIIRRVGAMCRQAYEVFAESAEPWTQLQAGRPNLSSTPVDSKSSSWVLG